MDAHSVSFTSTSQRETSRIWQDLKICRAQATIEPVDTDDMAESAAGRILTRLGKRRAQIIKRRPHVGIVGAGLAGLRCADILLQHGFQVTVIEGRNRLGGRVHQETLASGYTVDAGPNWIHGTNDNPILDLAKQTDTAVGTWDTRTSVLGEAGKLFSQADSEMYSTIMWDIIEDAFRHSNENCADIDEKESLWDFFQKEVVRRVPDSVPNFREQRNVVLQIAESWGAFVGSHISGQSLKYFWLEECIEGENLFCAGTYKNILKLIAKPAVEGASIRYETVVTGIASTSSETGGPVTVQTRGGETLAFDELVVTSPLGWLKRNMQKAFTPALPPRLVSAINSIGYGCLEKVYISFATAFWLKPEAKGDQVRGFCQWLAPNYAHGSNPQRWNQEMVELADLNPETSHATVLFYTYGDQSKYITSELARISSSASAASLSPEKTKAQREAFLYDWFKPYYSRLPCYEEGSDACQPTGCYATEWLGDELAGHGSYSNFQVGLSEGDRDVETMREGLPDQGLWLAGEHTAPFVALGTATGAYWSGESVGRRIAELYCKGKGGVPDLKL